MKKANETAKQGVAIEALGKELDALAPKQGAMLPETPGIGIKMGRNMREVGIDIVRMLGDAEEFEEGFVIGQSLHGSEFQPCQRDVRRIEIDSDDRSRISAKVIHDVATARGDRNDPALGRELQGFEIDNGIFPDLVVDKASEPHRKQALEKRLAPR